MSLSNADRETVFDVSRQWRDFLFSEIASERYSKLADVLFFFDPMTVDQMKSSGERLRACGRKLSEVKDQMLKEHKDECFQLIQEVRQTHDVFWGQLKTAREQKRREIGERIAGVLSRIEGNLEKNRDKLHKAEDALSRCEANIDKLRDLVAGAYSDEFRDRHQQWLNEAYEKQVSIRESIARIEAWIAEAELRRDDIYSKQR